MAHLPGRTLTRHVKRKAHLVSVFVRHGFGHLLAAAGWWRKSDGERHKLGKTETKAVNLVEALTEAGVTFVKLGQKLAARPDLLPQEYIKALSGLQDQVPPPPWEEIEAVLVSELGAPPDTVFNHFDRTPAASASIGVVYKARLHDGRPVAVKVQRPGIIAEIKADLSILAELADAVERHVPALRRLGPKKLVREFGEALRSEVDFLEEAAKTEHFHDALENHEGVHVPLPIRDYCHQKVLTMEWIEGRSVRDLDPMACGFDRSKVAKNLATSLLMQALDEGCFHGDPHHGNVRLLDDGRAVFLDFGNVSYIGRQAQNQFQRLLGAFFVQRADLISTVMVNAGVLGAGADIRAFQHDVDLLLAKNMGQAGVHPSLSAMFRDFLFLVNGYEVINLPSEWVALMISFGLIEGVCRDLDPDFSMMEVGKSYSHRFESAVKFEPQRWFMEHLLAAREFQDLVVALPGRFERLLTKLEAGDLKVRHEYEDAPSFFRPLSRVFDRLTTGLIVSALLLAGAWLTAGHGGSKFIEGLGLTLLVLAAGLGGWTLWSIFFRGGK